MSIQSLFECCKIITKPVGPPTCSLFFEPFFLSRLQASKFNRENFEEVGPKWYQKAKSKEPLTPDQTSADSNYTDTDVRVLVRFLVLFLDLTLLKTIFY